MKARQCLCMVGSLLFLFLLPGAAALASSAHTGLTPPDSVRNGNAMAGAADTTFQGLHIGKTDNLPSWWRFCPGDSVAFTLPYDNEANEYEVHNVVVTDALPAEME